MYYHRFTVASIVSGTTTTSSTAAPAVSKSKTHVIYYTKQYDQLGGQNAFDLNDEDEHRFMHHGVEENVIDHGHQQKAVKRFVLYKLHTFQ